MSAEQPPILLQVDDLHAGYGAVPVLHGLSLSVCEGEVVGVLGHNGMGKSTLLRTVMGYLPARAGHVAFQGRDITALPPFRRGRLGLGYVPQDRGVFPQLSVRDNLRLAWNRETGEAHPDRAVERILADFPRLEPLLDRRGGHLSGGEQQILALARCLIADPVLVLLDEPTEGIQPSIVEEIERILGRIRREQGLSMLLVEQNLEFITALSDRLLVMERGEVTAELSGAQMESPAIVEAFVGLGPGRRETAPTGEPPAEKDPVGR